MFFELNKVLFLIISCELDMVSNLEKRYIALTEDEEGIVDSVLSNSMNEEVIIEKFAIRINRSTLRRLGSSFSVNTDLWLNDEVSLFD